MFYIYANLNTECVVCNFCFFNLQINMTNAANNSGKESDNLNQEIHKMMS